MVVKLREQVGTDVARKFDYQMAVALDYLLSYINEDAIVLIETLEDFAVLHNFDTETEKIDIFQVKTKNSGLYTKNSLFDDNVLGKIVLTDFYFDSKANSLNIICNTNLKGTHTEILDNFLFEDKLTDAELKKLKENVMEYIKKKEPSFIDDLAPYIHKLIYIKSALPFSESQDRYSETLIGKTQNIIAQHLGDENHCINPQTIFNALKIIIDKQRRNRFEDGHVDMKDAIKIKGISTRNVKEIIDKAADANHLTKKEILNHASTIFSPEEYLKIKEEYSTFLAYKSNLADKVFIETKNIVEKEYKELTSKYDSIDEIVREVAYNCSLKISYYSLAVVQILTILVVFD